MGGAGQRAQAGSEESREASWPAVAAGSAAFAGTRQTSRRSELRSTVQLHPGPRRSESSQTHSLRRGPDASSTVHNVCRHVS